MAFIKKTILIEYKNMNKLYYTICFLSTYSKMKEAETLRSALEVKSIIKEMYPDEEVDVITNRSFSI